MGGGDSSPVGGVPQRSDRERAGEAGDRGIAHQAGPLDVRFITPARRELGGAFEYYERQGPGKSAGFLTDLEATLEGLRRNPESGSSYRHGTRHILLHRFPYRLVYSIEAGPITVIAVALQRRHPDHWSVGGEYGSQEHRVNDMAASNRGAGDPIVDVWLTDGGIGIDLESGGSIAVPLAWHPWLLRATAAQRANWRIRDGGLTVYWPDLGMELDAWTLLVCAPPPGGAGESGGLDSAVERTEPPRASGNTE